MQIIIILEDYGGEHWQSQGGFGFGFGSGFGSGFGFYFIAFVLG